MLVSELLKDLSQNMSDPNNEVLIAAEWNDELLDLVADALVACSEILNSTIKKALDVESVMIVDVPDQDLISVLQTAASAITDLDGSNDEQKIKLASVFDELLLTVCSNKSEIENIKKAQADELEKLRMKYRVETGEKLYPTAQISPDSKQIGETVEAIKKAIKPYRPMEHALSTRYSPDMPGVSMIRIGDNIYQCPVTKKIYDFKEGYTLDNGDKVPGSDVSLQTDIFNSNTPNQQAFSTREDALNLDR